MKSQITYRHMPHSAAMDQRIEAHMAKLAALHPRITTCHVVVQPIKSLSEHVLWKADARVIDGAVNGMGQIVAESGALLRQTQTGSLRLYAVSVLFGAVMIVGYYLWS